MVLGKSSLMELARKKGNPAKLSNREHDNSSIQFFGHAQFTWLVLLARLLLVVLRDAVIQKARGAAGLVDIALRGGR